jgi:hypothetical protein
MTDPHVSSGLACSRSRGVTIRGALSGRRDISYFDFDFDFDVDFDLWPPLRPAAAF